MKKNKMRECEAYISYVDKDTVLSYKIVNLSSKDVFIPNKFWINEFNDSLIIEAFDKDPMISYNQFMIPELKNLSVDSAATGNVEVGNFNNIISTHNCYLRIFDEKFEDYAAENKIEISTVYTTDFIIFEKKHSMLIKAMKVANKNW
jgi:hypothetical protein